MPVFFQNRTDQQCQYRWLRVLNPDLVKGPWTKEEDQKVTPGPEPAAPWHSRTPGEGVRRLRMTSHWWVLGWETGGWGGPAGLTASFPQGHRAGQEVWHEAVDADCQAPEGPAGQAVP